jgi:Pyruvate/2-oxoacid:ferredoxin oxidoreductase delta subunit
MNTRTMWVDVTRCTGCGACVEVCPVEAIALVDGKAHIDEKLCTGCGACVSACPEDAVQPVVQGELVPMPARPVPTAYRPSPLAEPAGAAVVAAGVGLLARAARALARAVGRWLTRPSAGPPAANGPSVAEGRGSAARGHRARHRQRGG